MNSINLKKYVNLDYLESKLVNKTTLKHNQNIITINIWDENLGSSEESKYAYLEYDPFNNLSLELQSKILYEFSKIFKFPKSNNRSQIETKIVTYTPIDDFPLYDFPQFTEYVPINSISKQLFIFGLNDNLLNELMDYFNNSYFIINHNCKDENDVIIINVISES